MLNEKKVCPICEIIKGLRAKIAYMHLGYTCFVPLIVFELFITIFIYWQHLNII